MHRSPARIAFLALCICLLSSGPASASPASTPAGDGPQFGSAMQALLNDGDVGTNKEFERYKVMHHTSKAPPCPADLRTLAMNWNDCSARSEYSAFWLVDDEISLSWNFSFSLQEDMPEAMDMLVKKLTAAGFQETNGAYKTKHMANTHAHGTLNPTKSFFRSIGGDSEEIYFSGFQKSRGADSSGTRSTTSNGASRKYTGSPPTLDELLAACPMLNSKQLAPPVRQPLHDQAVYYFQPSQGWVGRFAGTARPGFEAALKQLQFRPASPIEIRKAAGDIPKGSRHVEWYAPKKGSLRETVWNDDSRIQIAWESTLRDFFSSGREEAIPRDKWRFMYPGDEALFAGTEVIALRLGLVPNVRNSQTAVWPRVAEQWHAADDADTTQWLSKNSDHPFHSVALYAYPYERESGQFGIVMVDAAWAPAKSGWGSAVRMETLASDYDRNTTNWNFTFAKFVDGHLGDEKLELYPGDYRHNEKFGDTTYQIYTMRMPDGFADSTASKLFDSPEGLRDFGTQWIESVRKRAIGAIQQGAGANISAMRPNTEPQRGHGGIPDARLDFLPSDRPMTEDEKKIAIQHVNDEMDHRKRLLTANFRETHAALVESFPWKECLKEKARR